LRRRFTPVFVVLALFFCAVIAYSGYQIWSIQAKYRQEAKLHRELMQYKPSGITDTGENTDIYRLLGTYPDAVGWIVIPNTLIDYPFVQHVDNDFYLRRDIDGYFSEAGTIFLDYRCNKDFSSRNTILYGHHMNNGSMFGTILKFGDPTFFADNEFGTLYLEKDTLTLEFFAYMVLNPATERVIYHDDPDDDFVDYIRRNARNYRDVGLSKTDRFVTLSTCSYEFEDARMVLIARAASMNRTSR
jgi:sortase B